MPAPGDTAVLALVPELDGLLDAIARRWAGRVRPGLGAHVALLYPFLPSDQVTDQVVRRCAELCAGRGVVPVRFETCRVRPGIVMTCPEPPGPLADLSGRFRREWPQCPPYGGAYGEEPELHVSLALGGDAREAGAIAEWASGALPVVAEVAGAELVELTEQGWTPRARFQF